MSAKFRIEPGDAIEPKHCLCCGGTTRALTRFVYDANNDAYAIYYAAFTDNHPDKVIKISISIGGWGTDDVSSRRTFTIWYKGIGADKGFMAKDPGDNPWQGIATMGKYLNRNEALSDNDMEEIWTLCDEIIVNDMDVNNYISS